MNVLKTTELYVPFKMIKIVNFISIKKKKKNVKIFRKSNIDK